MKLLVFTAAFYDRDYEEKLFRLNKSCEKNDIDMVAYGRGETFYFYEAKIVKLGNFLNEHKAEYTHALFTDAADTLFLSSLDEIIEKYKKFNVPLLLSTEKFAYPGHIGGDFPESPTPYRYFNAGGFIGEIPYLLDTLSKLKTYYWVNDNDNAHWMYGYVNKRIKLDMDYHCDIFQTMSDVDFGTEMEIKDGRLFNKVTGSKPSIVHFNGPKGAGTRNDELMQLVYEKCVLGE